MPRLVHPQSLCLGCAPCLIFTRLASFCHSDRSLCGAELPISPGLFTSGLWRENEINFYFTPIFESQKFSLYSSEYSFSLIVIVEDGSGLASP